MSAWHARATPVVAAIFLALLVAPAAHAEPAPPVTDPTPTTATGPTTTLAPTSGPTTTTPRAPVTVPPGGFGRPPKPKPGAKPEPKLPDPSPQVRILLDQLRLADQQKIVRTRAAAVERARGVERSVAGQVREAEAGVRRAERSVRNARKRLRLDAVSAYVRPEQTGIEQLLADRRGDDESRNVLLSVTIAHEKKVLRAAQDRVLLRKALLVALRGSAATARRHTAEAQATVDQASQVEDRRRQELNVALYGGDTTWSLPIEGASVFTPAELAAWFAQHGVRSRASAGVDELAYFYVKEGRDEDVRGDMAFAQSILETGSFTNRDTVTLNNFAGIGHCDTCPSGFAFASARLGVRAQVQLLASYADAQVRFHNPMVDPRLRGLPGCCRTWRDLTHTWATDGNYGAKLMNVYRGMLYWLVVHRGLAPAVGPG